jgi:hypothetical protein
VMKISLTIFQNIFDNKTHRQLELSDFSAFESFLYKLSQEPKASKKDAVLISPAIYKQNTTRSNDNVLEWAGWCCMDVDDYIPDGDLKDDLCNKLSSYRFICYSTASSTLDTPKFRLVFPLRTRVDRKSIRHFWFALNRELGELGDAQTKDLSRMYYIPAKYSGAFNFIFSHDGDSIDVYDLLRKHPYAEKANLNSFFDRLPEELQKQIVEHRKGKMDNTDISWTSYRDCPFFPRKLEAEYRVITNTGWYHKMYQIMVALAGNAVKKQYPITAIQIAKLCSEFDAETGNWYKNRPLDKEADRALEYVYKNM